MLFEISQKWAFFANFLRGAWGEFYKSWPKSNKFQSFQLILPIVNLTVQFLSRNIEMSQKLLSYLHAQKSCALQYGGMTLMKVHTVRRQGRH